jgi:hypothetical protein
MLSKSFGWKMFISPENLVQHLHKLGFSGVIVPTLDEIDA